MRGPVASRDDGIFASGGSRLEQSRLCAPAISGLQEHVGALGEQASAWALQKHGAVTEADEVMTGARNSNVQQVGPRIQESERGRLRHDATEEHDAALTALKPMHRAE